MLNESHTAQLQNELEAAVSQHLQLADVTMDIPASLNFLPVLCAALREYCAALPILAETTESIHEPQEHFEARSRFGTGPLQLPGRSGSTITVSYSHLVYSLELALQEAGTNVVRHGYDGGNLEQRIKIHLSVQNVSGPDQKEQRGLVIELFDNGVPFDTANSPYDLPPPTQLSESGYGLYLIHKLTDQLQYFQQAGQNCLRMVKFL